VPRCRRISGRRKSRRHRERDSRKRSGKCERQSQQLCTSLLAVSCLHLLTWPLKDCRSDPVLREVKKKLPELCSGMPVNRLQEVMPKGGLEPPRAYAHCALNAARLPIPPLRRELGNIALIEPLWNHIAAAACSFTGVTNDQ
jgi:hypothetical protein